MFLQAVLETVAKITHDKGKKNDTQEGKYGNIQLTFDFTVSVHYDFFLNVIILVYFLFLK